MVTYNTIVAVSNDALKLMPGMTATVSVETQRRDGVLRVPAAAARFRPEPAGGGVRMGSRSGGPPREGAAREGSTRDGTARDNARSGGRPLFVPGKGGRPEPRAVKLGLADGRFVEVLEGLQEGETVITGLRGAAVAASGTRPSPAATNNPFSPRREQRTR